MTSGDARRTSRIRLLTREELALWRHVTVDVKSNKGKGFLYLPASERSARLAMLAPSTPSADKPAEPSADKKEISPRLLPPLAPLEQRLKRRLSSGKAQVDGVIDLHGLTQAQAHRALRNFLWRSAEDGAKLVLVITGKGLPEPGWGQHVGERGVLRRNTPHWLRAPDLRSIVLSVEEASRTHGGAGALYVRLRRCSSG